MLLRHRFPLPFHCFFGAFGHLPFAHMKGVVKSQSSRIGKRRAIVAADRAKARMGPPVGHVRKGLALGHRFLCPVAMRRKIFVTTCADRIGHARQIGTSSLMISMASRARGNLDRKLVVVMSWASVTGHAAAIGSPLTRLLRCQGCCEQRNCRAVAALINSTQMASRA